MSEIVYQVRCIRCKKEQYMPAVPAISRGEHGCVWCGHVPPVFTSERDYWLHVHAPSGLIKEVEE